MGIQSCSMELLKICLSLNKLEVEVSHKHGKRLGTRATVKLDNKCGHLTVINFKSEE